MSQITNTAGMSHAELEAVLDSILVDLTALKTAIDTMAAKLNADAGVTDVNYAAAAALTTTT